MDPNETLKQMLEQTRLVIAVSDDVNALKLADYVNAMNEWLSKGGFLPAAWVAGTSANDGRWQAV